MEVKCAIEEIFNAVKSSHEENAKTLLERAKKEVDLVSKVEHISEPGKASLRSISKMISQVSNGKINEAKKKYQTAERQFNVHVKKYLTDKLKEVHEVELLSEKSNEQNTNGNKNTKTRAENEHKERQDRPNNIEESQLPHDTAKGQDVNDKAKSQYSDDKAKSQHSDDKVKSQHADYKEKCQFPDERSNDKFITSTSNLPSNKLLMENNGGSNVEEQGPDEKVILRRSRHKALGETDKTAEEKRSSKANDEFQVIEKSKRASQAMRQNNPEIADLSDTNRPTKIAERFSELYDNEWTEAFEELTRKSKTEKEIINYLLSIVKRAYKFCNDKAECEINLIVKAFNRILEFGPQDFNSESAISQSNAMSKEGKGIMIQYRKEIADKAIPRLKEAFKSTIMKKGNEKMRLPVHMKSVDRFAESAVELTWWMCVQDPPVYLCPTDDSGEEGFDSNLYKAYTKSGSKPDFFVWPALRLYKDGAVLMKGVVQYL